MAKLSSINKNERRKKLVVKYAAKITALKAKANDKSLDDTERLIARLKLAEVPRKRFVLRVVQRLVAKEDHAMLDQGGADFLIDLGRLWLRQIDVFDFGADVCRHRRDADIACVHGLVPCARS